MAQSIYPRRNVMLTQARHSWLNVSYRFPLALSLSSLKHAVEHRRVDTSYGAAQIRGPARRLL